MTAICVNGLRTNASIISAFMNQCDRVIPVDSVEEAVIAGKQFPGDSIITGGLDIRDKFFELTNSPLEFTEEAVAGKVIIHCSGNGSRCIKASFDAKNSFVGHLINATAVAKRVLPGGRRYLRRRSGNQRQAIPGGYVLHGLHCGPNVHHGQ